MLGPWIMRQLGRLVKDGPGIVESGGTDEACTCSGGDQVSSAQVIRPSVCSLSTLAIMSLGHSWSLVGKGQCSERHPVLSQWQYYTLEKKKKKKGSCQQKGG